MASHGRTGVRRWVYGSVTEKVLLKAGCGMLIVRPGEQRARMVLFTNKMLADLKAVYDQVERARTLLPAGQSAKTYGNEMRDLVEERVRLLHSERALERGDNDLGTKVVKEVLSSVELMEAYLKTLTDEFKKRYRPCRSAL
jgi:hypothetical protein